MCTLLSFVLSLFSIIKALIFSGCKLQWIYVLACCCTTCSPKNRTAFPTFYQSKAMLHIYMVTAPAKAPCIPGPASSSGFFVRQLHAVFRLCRAQLLIAEVVAILGPNTKYILWVKGLTVSLLSFGHDARAKCRIHCLVPKPPPLYPPPRKYVAACQWYIFKI